jgi:hypothetical protein
MKALIRIFASSKGAPVARDRLPPIRREVPAIGHAIRSNDGLA